MADLITLARAKYNLNNRATTSNEDTTLAALITAVSRAVRRYCGREFDSQQLDELYAGSGGARLLLRQFPILSVARVAAGPTTVLEITNTASANQRATVAVTSTGLTLVRVASGTTTTNTSVTWAGNSTLGAVATAVNALGNGWSATVASAYSIWPSADLRAVQGALNARGVAAGLVLHVDELADYGVDAERGWLTRPGGWPEGVDRYRVIYTAGYATVPEDVQEACAQWVAALFWQTKRDPGLAQEQVPGSISRSPSPQQPPASVAVLLQPYRDLRLLNLRG